MNAVPSLSVKPIGKDGFVDKDVAFLLDLWDSLDLMEERIKTANEDLSDILFGSNE